MSLISVNNFIAPLTNKVHLATIFFVACAFAVFRLSGGGIERVPLNQRRPAIQTSTPSVHYSSPAKRIVTESRRVPARKTAPVLKKKNNYGDVEDLDSLFSRPRGQRNVSKTTRAHTGSRSAENKLKEIEELVGLQ
ncbi:MAG: hypothetical protein D6719_02600 [Candidatus Dadabacteria bacterium]|nr:MAG: hypothetical protein D6719_02600 [Candidatus Dadabacteria bacterium]